MSDPTFPPDAQPQPSFVDQGAMDPAQQSLADALRITFRLLQLVMILLVALFLASGFQTVEESQRGVKLVFGRVVEEDVPPGVTWNWPFPVGELVKVKTSQQQMELDYSFAPLIRPGDRGRPLRDVMPNDFKLDPAKAGSVITGDGNIAHTWWRAVWRRSEPARNARNVYPPDEADIVQRAVERGVVRAVAEVTIDGLLKQGGGVGVQNGQGGGESSLGLRAREVAQRTLDDMQAGITIDALVLNDKAPPRRVLDNFDMVSKAEAEAAKRREEADKQARETLNSVAGDAHAALLAMIDEYERAVELHDDAKGKEVLGLIDRVIEGEPVTVDGREERASGRVTSVIAAARQYRTDMVASSQARAARFLAKRPTFLQDPKFFVASEWTPAYRRFIESNKAQVFFQPAGSEPELWLNRNPNIAADAERKSNAAESASAYERLQESRDRAAREARERSRAEPQKKPG